MPPETKSAKITTDQVLTCRKNLGKVANYPPNPDRPMIIRQVKPLAPPEGNYTHQVVTQLAEDVDGIWTIDAKPIRFTAARLHQIYNMVCDRLNGLLVRLAEQDFVLNLDDLQIREEFRNRAEACVKAALVEDNFTDVVGVVVKYAIRTDKSEINFVADATARFRGDLFDLKMRDPAMPPETELL